MLVCVDFKASGLSFDSRKDRFPRDSKQAGQCIPTLETLTRAEQFLRPELLQARLPRSLWLWEFMQKLRWEPGGVTLTSAQESPVLDPRYVPLS